MICEKCMHIEECFEQRGRCSKFETEKQYKKRIRSQLEQLNENKEAIAARAAGEED